MNVAHKPTNFNPIIIQRNSHEQLRLALSSYSGRVRVDLRSYFLDDDGEWKPSRKGLSISPELWPEVQAGLQQLDAQLRDRGLLDVAGDGEEGDHGAS